MSEVIKVVSPADPILNEIALEIAIKDIKKRKVQKIIDEMYIFANGEQGDKSIPTLVGLAGPQIGYSLRIVLIGMNSVGVGEQPILQEFINPEIIYRSKTKEDGREGCYSTGRVCGVVSRSKSVTIKGYDRTGNKITHKLTGFPARVAQHEVDHLNGIRFPDLISTENKLHWVVKKNFGKYRKDWKNWPVVCPKEKWLKIKNGA